MLKAPALEAFNLANRTRRHEAATSDEDPDPTSSRAASRLLALIRVCGERLVPVKWCKTRQRCLSEVTVTASLTLSRVRVHPQFRLWQGKELLGKT